MSKQTLLIDNVAFAKKNERLSGELAPEDFSRLQELLHSSNLSATAASQNGTISYVLQGKVDAMGQHMLQLSLMANLPALCQRCLNVIPLTLNLHFNYLIDEVSDVDVEALDVDNDDNYDLQQANKTMDLMALIEDELIMAMPIAPMHEEGCTELATQSGEKPNPFAVLKGLIKS